MFWYLEFCNECDDSVKCTFFFNAWLLIIVNLDIDQDLVAKMSSLFAFLLPNLTLPYLTLPNLTLPYLTLPNITYPNLTYPILS